MDERIERMHRIYEWLHIANDFALAGWFLVGSILFMTSRLAHIGTWLFVVGSAQMMAGPVLRIIHKLHAGVAGRPREAASAIDF